MLCAKFKRRACTICTRCFSVIALADQLLYGHYVYVEHTYDCWPSCMYTGEHVLYVCSLLNMHDGQQLLLVLNTLSKGD